MKDKPQFKIRANHILGMLISAFMWIVIIAIYLTLTSCLQSISAIAPEAAPQKAIPTAAIRAPITEIDNAIIIPATGMVTRTVCAVTLYVRGAPNTMGAPTRYLTRGEVVNIREWDKRGTGWAMIAPAEWINADFLCKVTP